MTETQMNTKKKIIEAASYLFGVQGFDGTSTREIGRRAGVNISSLNYHFKSKQNLLEEVASFACEELKLKIRSISLKPELVTSADFALELYKTLLADGSKNLNDFKLFLDSKNLPDLGETPMGLEELTVFLKKELNANVPPHEYLWFNTVLFGFVFHTAIVSTAVLGKQFIEKFLPEKYESNHVYIKQLVESLIRDLNNRYQ